MVTHALWSFVFLLPGPLLAAEELPLEVAGFIERSQLCEHFRQEPWPEGASAAERDRRKFITDQIERYCTGLDSAARELKHKYRDERAVIEKLDDVEALESNR